MKFDNGEIVQFDHETYGKGTGTVVGYYAKDDVYAIMPKIPHDWDDYGYFCLMIEAKKLISTPF